MPVIYHGHTLTTKIKFSDVLHTIKEHAFVAIGLFASALTNNQIVAFIIAALLCAFCYLGFDSLYALVHGRFALQLRSLGPQVHYESISRGVIDTRDVIYFLSVITLFIMLTRTVLQSRKWQK